VTRHGWGEIEVERLGRFRDVKVWPGGGRAWDWNETGTRHDPGVQPDDVAELLEHDPAVVVLGRGRYGRLAVCPETVTFIEGSGARVTVAETSAAIDEYNRLAAEGVRVAGLFHTTC
jgi:hypothetical protein